MGKKINVVGNSVMLDKVVCSEIIQPRRLMRALMREYEFSDVVSWINAIYGLPLDEAIAMYFKLKNEKKRCP